MVGEAKGRDYGDGGLRELDFMIWRRVVGDMPSISSLTVSKEFIVDGRSSFRRFI
jgi:hypothetical protein